MTNSKRESEHNVSEVMGIGTQGRTRAKSNRKEKKVAIGSTDFGLYTKLILLFYLLFFF